MSPGSGPLPDDPAELAMILVQEGAAGPRSAAALERLRPVIEVAARQVRRGLERRFRAAGLATLPADPAPEAVRVVWGRLVGLDPDNLNPTSRQTFDLSRGTSFPRWCRPVLRNWMVDQLRQAGRAPGSLPASTGESPEEEVPDHDERGRQERAAQAARALQEKLVAIREVLDEVASPRWQARQVNRYVVFLLELRIGLARKVGGSWGESGPPAGEVAALVARLLPWHEREERQRMHTQGPGLGVLWFQLESCLDHPPYHPRAEDVCARLNQLWTGPGTVTAANWQQWTNRSRQYAHAEIEESLWEELFAPLLPRPRTPTEDPGACP